MLYELKKRVFGKQKWQEIFGNKALSFQMCQRVFGQFQSGTLKIPIDQNNQVLTILNFCKPLLRKILSKLHKISKTVQHFDYNQL